MTQAETEDLPGFSQPQTMPVDPLPPEATVTGPTTQSSPTPDRPKVSGPADESAPPAPSGRTTGTSSTTSSEVDEALAGYGAAGFMLATAAINKAAEARTHQPTSRWLATEEETQRFGDALGRIAGRRVPDELTESGDAVDYLIMGEVALSYGLRTVLNLSAEEAVAAGEQWLEEQAPQAPPPEATQTPQSYGPPPPTAPEPRTTPLVVPDPAENGNFGAVAATPAPPDVISPLV